MGSVYFISFALKTYSTLDLHVYPVVTLLVLLTYPRLFSVVRGRGLHECRPLRNRTPKRVVPRGVGPS